MKLLKKIFGDENTRAVKKITPTIEEINALEIKFQALSDEELRSKTAEFKKRVSDGETLDDLLPEAFAVVKNACRRLVGRSWKVRGNDVKWEMVPYDVQLIGGIIIHENKIAEMKTGEGKTLVCTLPLYLNALSGKGCHLVTVNDYLALRDSEWMRGLFEFLGMTVGTLSHGISQEERRAAYACDITYGTNTEFGFDYLRDNMARSAEECVQRELKFAIVDEVDSILIDEARTPLIISAPAAESTSKYSKYSQLIRQLVRDEDFELDEKGKVATLTEEGIAKMERLLGVTNIYTEAGFSEVHHIEQALKAEYVFTLDKDYVVRDGEVIIVDEFTGRLMPGRRFSDGLHQALEAKEGTEIRRQSRTLATITLQNYFRMYEKLAGMTGTALTESEEFGKIYGLGCVAIPTNQEVERKDLADKVYKTEVGKLKAVVEEIREIHATGRPVLVGTISIERSELIGKMLTAAGIPHKILNAKHHEAEAEIIARAGEKNAVTIATNMAGRGTDIKLGEGVKELGGLAILGTERHESRRIDNQLRGRAGRQGDPGSSQFFVSMQDSLLRLFGGEKMQKMMEALNIPDDMPIENRMITGSIESAQKKVEAHNFEIRKHLVEYDDVANAQRKIIYDRRRKILDSEDISARIEKLIREEGKEIANATTAGRERNEWQLEDIVSATEKLTKQAIDISIFGGIKDPKEVAEKVSEFLVDIYKKREAALPDTSPLRHTERQVYLSTVDRLWMEHLEELREIREKVSLRGYGQRDPLLEYKHESYLAFERLLSAIRANTLFALFAIEIGDPSPAAEQAPEKIETNEDAVEDIETGDRELVSEDLTDKEKSEVVEKITIVSADKEEEDETPISDAEVAEKAAEFFKPNPEISNLGKDGVTVIRADDETSSEKKEVGRNDPCPCGSGKKYKKCCGK